MARAQRGLTRSARESGPMRRAARRDGARTAFLLRRPDDSPRRGAHVLLADVALPGRAGGALAARAARPVPADLRRDRRLPARRRAQPPSSIRSTARCATRCNARARHHRPRVIRRVPCTGRPGRWRRPAAPSTSSSSWTARSQLPRRKTIDVLFTVVLMALVLASLVMVFLGGGLADDLLGYAGLGRTAADVWANASWPGAAAVAMLVFALIYYVTPDVKQRGFHWLTPGAVVAVLLWLAASFGFSALRVQRRGRRGVLRRVRGRHRARRVAVAAVRRTALRRRAQAEIERERELSEGVPRGETSMPVPVAGRR